MKATHNQIVKLLEGMGYLISDIYPDLNITVMKRDCEYMTVTGSKWAKGKWENN